MRCEGKVVVTVARQREIQQKSSKIAVEKKLYTAKNWSGTLAEIAEEK
jgi:hypothetical protein